MGKESYSFAWRRAVVKDPSLSSITKLVLHTLHFYMDNNTGECFPSRETIAEDASLNVRTITPHLTKAQKAGYLIKTKKPTKGKYKRNAYKGIIPLKSIEETQRNLQEYKNKEGEFECPQKGTDVPTNSSTNSSEENSLYNLFPLFNIFWYLYPAYRRVKKRDCLDIWRDNNLNDCADIISEHLRDMIKSNAWLDGYTPSVYNYLSGEHWVIYEKKSNIWDGGI